MESDSLVPRQALGRWAPKAFVVGGTAWLLLMAVVGGNMLTDGSTPAWLVPGLLVPGLLAAYVGLAGIYVRVAGRSPRLARISLGVVLIAAALVVFAVVYTVATGTISDGPPFPVFPLIVLSTIASFLLMGAASARTGTPSRRVGLLVAVPGAAWLGDIVFILARSTLGISEVAGVPLIVVPTTGVVIAALAMVAAGYLLQTRFPTTDRSEATPDTTAR